MSTIMSYTYYPLTDTQRLLPNHNKSHVGRYIFTHKGKKKKGKPNYSPLGQQLKERCPMPAWREQRKRLNRWLRGRVTDRRRIARKNRHLPNDKTAEHLFINKTWLNQL